MKQLRANFVVLILMNLGNLFAYLFQLSLGRLMSPAEYGQFNAIFSLVLVLTAPTVALPLVYSRFTVELLDEGKGALCSLVKRSLISSAAVAVVLVILGLGLLSPLQELLHISEISICILMLVLMAISLLFPVVLGVLQGLREFTKFSIGQSLVPFIRFAGGLFFVGLFGLGVNGALFACIAGAIVALLYGAWELRSLNGIAAKPLPPGMMQDIVKYIVPVVLTNTLILALTNIDVVLVRHFFTPEESGVYASAAIVGRIGILLPGVLIYVLFPETVRAQKENGRSHSALWMNIALTGLIGILFVFACNLWGKEILGLLMGDTYIAGGDILRLLSVAMVVLAMVQALLTYLLARQEYHYMPFLAGGVVCFITVVCFFHSDAVNVAWMLLAVNLGVLLFSLLRTILPNVTFPHIGLSKK